MTARETTLALLRAELEAAMEDITLRWGGAVEITGSTVMLEAVPHAAPAEGVPPPAPEREPLRLDLGRLPPKR